MDAFENYYRSSNENFNINQPSEFTSINNYFNLKLIKNINKNDYIYSPYSISYLTLLLYLASTETTKEELANLFGINSSKDDKDIIESMLNINRELLKSGLIKTANCFLINKNYYNNIKKIFLQLLQKTSTIISCDFANNSEKIVHDINHWIANQTNDLIKDVISSSDISGMTQLLAINTIYFKSFWLYPFKNIKTDKFINSFDKELYIDFMNQSNDYSYYDNNDIQLLEMPYQRKKFSFGIFLPKNDNNLRITNNFTEYIQQMSIKKVEIFIPKFKQKYHLELKEIFRKMNCNRMFEMGNAEFYNMIKDKDGLHVSDIFQDAIIIVDENGTEAAAATVAILKNECYTRTIEFKANHTFQYYIRHIPSNTIIFQGIFDGNSI